MSRKKPDIVYRITDEDGDQVAVVVGRSPRGAVHTAKQIGHAEARHAHVVSEPAASAINFRPKKGAA